MKRVFALVLALALGACSGDGDELVARAAKPGSTPGGMLTIAIGDPGSIDPANADDRWSKFVVSLLCDPLIQLDPITGEPVPAIAESWVSSNGGTQLTLKLRKGVRFHDGSALTADDVVAQLTRVASQEQASNVAALLRPIAGWAVVHGDEESDNEEELSRLAGARAIGTHAVQISLTEARSDFFRVLAHPLASPVPRAAATDTTTFEAQPICAGPYRMTGPWRGDDRIVLERSPHYYARNLGYTRGGAGYADRIELRVNARAADVVVSVTAARDGNVTGPTPYLEYIALPVDAPLLDRRETRVALSRAIDRTAIARTVYRGGRSVARGFMPPALGSLYRSAACGAAAPARADVAGARAMLAAAGIDLTGRTLTLTYNPDFENRALAEAVAGQWERAFGARVRLVSLPWERYIGQATATSGLGGAFRMGWEPPYVGPDAMLAPLFSSVSIGTDNVSRYADPRFDRVLERDARRATVEEDLRDEYRRLEDLVCEQMPAIPVVYGGARYKVARAKVDSAVDRFVDLTSGMPLARELFVRR